MTDQPREKQALSCKCGATFEVLIPITQLTYTVHFSQVLLIPDPIETRQCTQCGMVWTPRVKEPKNIEWVAFKKADSPSLAKPSLGDVQKFG